MSLQVRAASPQTPPPGSPEAPPPKPPPITPPKSPRTAPSKPRRADGRRCGRVGRRVLIACLLLLLSSLGPPSSTAQAGDPAASDSTPNPPELDADVGSPSNCTVLWDLPVDAPITDGYRPPVNPFGAGNRGLEFGTQSGDPVRAVADGVVRFAGPVGNNKFVTVEEPSGLRATYGFVEQVLVAAGQTIDRGALVAVAGPGFHLTARVGSRYRDPTPLLEVTCYRVRLVPVPDRFTTG